MVEIVETEADPLDATAIAPARVEPPSEAGGGTLGEDAGKSPTVITRGTLIGRYIVADPLGAGAMGVVFAAYDPELDRKVALKLIRYQGEDPGVARARLQREAQALAKLDHHNVVSVYDVGTHRAQLFVAMEFVEGRDLQAWMAAGPHPWREVLAVFMAAGRGLAAAHGAGLVHRDVKPANLMLDDDGRVRVMDFGLARVSDTLSTPDAPARDQDQAQVQDRHLDAPFEQLPLLTGNALSAPMTREGALIGTPAYMAPEQLMGRAASEASDQFGFCVSLYQGLYGVRPFTGSSLRELLAAIEAKELAAPSSSASSPAWLREVLSRGLAPSPDARWPSMDALLDALSDDPAIRRRKWAAGLGAAALIGVSSVGLSAALETEDVAASTACVGFEAALDEVWDGGRRDALRNNLVGTGLSYAEETATRVEVRLDDYSAKWVQARTEACMATERGEQSGELLDLRMACLDERRAHLVAMVTLFSEEESPPVDRAIAAVAALPRLSRCADVEALRARQPPPEDPEVAAAVERMEAELIELNVLANAGQFAAGLARAEALVRETQTLGYAPVDVRARLQLAFLQEDTGDFAGAERTLELVYAKAVTLEMAREVARATAMLIYVVGTGLQRVDDGLTWAKHAEPWSKVQGQPGAEASYFNMRGALALQQGELELARHYYGLTLAIYELTLGPNHPDLGRCMSNLGTTAYRQGELELARASHERALAIFEASLGPHHPDVAGVLSNLGTVALAAGELATAKEVLTRALKLSEETLGPDHPKVATYLLNLGGVNYGLRRYVEAQTQFERALKIYEDALGPEHPGVAMILGNLAGVALRRGELAKAEDLSERALTTLEGALSPDSLELATPLVNLGQALLALDRPDEALPHLERALSLAVERFIGVDLAEFQHSLARALWRAGPKSDRVRALGLARAAEAAYAVSAHHADELSATRTWLAERG